MLSSETEEKIEILSNQGEDLINQRLYKEAVDKFVEALELLPDPMTKWQQSTSILTAIGDAHFMDDNYEYALHALSDAMHCPNALGNPFIHMRLGQVQFELGNNERAADELTRAYMAAGEDVFEDDDPKYLEFLKTVIKM